MSKYFADAYTKEFNATLTHVDQDGFILDKSYFYPQGGGQPADHGTIQLPDGTRVDVTHTSKQDGQTYHHADTTKLQEGQDVVARIDWKRRYTLMRMHTAAHVISAVLAQEEDASITGNKLSIDESRIDYDLDDYDKETILGYEQRINNELAKHHDVSTKTLPREEAEQELAQLSSLEMGLPSHITQVRIVQIGDLDAQACGGTHVKNTKEIGAVELTRTKNKGANNRRVYYTLS